MLVSRTEKKTIITALQNKHHELLCKGRQFSCSITIIQERWSMNNINIMMKRTYLVHVYMISLCSMLVLHYGGEPFSSPPKPPFLLSTPTSLPLPAPLGPVSLAASQPIPVRVWPFAPWICCEPALSPIWPVSGYELPLAQVEPVSLGTGCGARPAPLWCPGPAFLWGSGDVIRTSPSGWGGTTGGWGSGTDGSDWGRPGNQSGPPPPHLKQSHDLCIHTDCHKKFVLNYQYTYQVFRSVLHIPSSSLRNCLGETRGRGSSSSSEDVCKRFDKYSVRTPESTI